MALAPGEPPPSLRLVAQMVKQRLDEAQVHHTVGFLPPTDTAPWRLSVDSDKGYVDLVFGNQATDVVWVVDAYDEEVSPGLATEFVAMSLDLLGEEEWRAMLGREQAAVRQAAAELRTEFRRARRARWRARLHWRP